MTLWVNVANSQDCHTVIRNCFSTNPRGKKPSAPVRCAGLCWAGRRLTLRSNNGRYNFYSWPNKRVLSVGDQRRWLDSMRREWHRIHHRNARVRKEFLVVRLGRTRETPWVNWFVTMVGKVRWKYNVYPPWSLPTTVHCCKENLQYPGFMPPLRARLRKCKENF